MEKERRRPLPLLLLYICRQNERRRSEKEKCAPDPRLPITSCSAYRAQRRRRRRRFPFPSSSRFSLSRLTSILRTTPAPPPLRLPLVLVPRPRRRTCGIAFPVNCFLLNCPPFPRFSFFLPLHQPQHRRTTTPALLCSLHNGCKKRGRKQGNSFHAIRSFGLPSSPHPVRCFLLLHSPPLLRLRM